MEICMNINTEKPLDRLVEGYSNTAAFRTMGFVGDSLSSGEFETVNKDNKSEYHDLYEYSWGQFIARKNGQNAYNFSHGGMTAKMFVESYADENDFWNIEKSCQAYVIALGVNDLICQDMELGSIEDLDAKDYRNNAKTFAGYYSQIISRYKEISPDAKFFLVGFPKYANENRNKIAENLNGLLYDFSDYFNNVYVIDLYKYGSCYDDEFRKKYFLNGHLNPMGYIYTAKIIDSYIDYIIRQNPSDFKYCGLINSGIEYIK